MLSTVVIAALSLAVLPSATALSNIRRGDGFLRLPVAAINPTELPQVSKRQEVVPLANTLSGTTYLVNFTIGFPAQPVSLLLDTGSSHTWVNPTCSTAGSRGKRRLCNSLPVFDPSTSRELFVSKHLSYGTGDVVVEFYTDNFTIGGVTIVDQRFGVAIESIDLDIGIMGVGPGIELIGYRTIIDQLAIQGITNSRAFSLDLRSVDTPEGSIIFGGIDTKKYTGPLEKRPIIRPSLAPGGMWRYWIYMTSVGITKPGDEPKLYASNFSNPQGQAVFLDSGGTLSRLPTPLVNSIVADFPGASSDSDGLYPVDCNFASQDGTVDFGFGNTTIHVPYHEFIWATPTGDCYLGIMEEDYEPVLGDSFLRAAFVVYDQDNQNLHLANAVDCGSNVVAIGEGVDAVPSVTGDCGPPSSTSSASSSSSPADVAQPSQALKASETQLSSASSAGMSAAKLASVGLGAVALVSMLYA